MTTERLYYDDSRLLRFDAEVIGHATHEGQPSVLLDRSAFYPEAGGQMADHGELCWGDMRRPVIDVQQDAEGRVHHLLGGEALLPAVGDRLQGTIDKTRRLTHMALHTGQHMLSRALQLECGADTVSSRLGENECNIDVDKEALSDGLLGKAEALVNSVIDDDVMVRAFFPTNAELARLELRRTIKVADNVRVVQVGDFDNTPCGGTHCTSSAQVGLVRIVRTERVKGRLRVLFTAGPRARGQLFGEQDALYRLARSFTCGPLEVEDAVERLRAERKELNKELGVTRGRLAEGTADELLRDAEQRGEKVIVAAFEGADATFLKVVAERLTRGPRAALLAAPSDDGTFVMLARGEGSDVDCGALLKAAAQATGGKGGGKPALAQGRLPGRVDWPTLIATLRG